MIENIKLLDCTLRDGGLCLEDIVKSDGTEKGMSAESINRVMENLSDSKIDIIELGCMEITKDDRRRFSIYPNMESISAMMPRRNQLNQMYAGLYRGPDIPLKDIPEWNESLCSVVRVIIRYSELQKSLDFCAGLSQKGYKVFVQPMLTMRYSEEEIDLLINEANAMNAYALYFVDSYGYMKHEDVDYFFGRYDSGLKPDIHIGFHSHNNMNLAYSNVLHLLNRETSRGVIIDSCITGMGQGAGNLQTELIVPYLNENCSKSYDYNAVLDACEEIEKYTYSSKWGYSVTRLLPAINKTAYKYSAALRNQYGLSYKEINSILKHIPEDLRHRYTVENVEKLLHTVEYVSA